MHCQMMPAPVLVSILQPSCRRIVWNAVCAIVLLSWHKLEPDTCVNWFDTELDALHALRKKPPRDRLALAEEDDDNDWPEEEVLSVG